MHLLFGFFYQVWESSMLLQLGIVHSFFFFFSFSWLSFTSLCRWATILNDQLNFLQTLALFTIFNYYKYSYFVHSYTTLPEHMTSFILVKHTDVKSVKLFSNISVKIIQTCYWENNLTICIHCQQLVSMGSVYIRGESSLPYSTDRSFYKNCKMLTHI